MTFSHREIRKADRPARHAGTGRESLPLTANVPPGHLTLHNRLQFLHFLLNRL